MEKGRPVNDRYQVVQRLIGDHPRSQETRRRLLRSLPINRGPPFPGLFQRQQLLQCFLAFIGFARLLLLPTYFFHEPGLFVLVQQLPDDVHGQRRIRHVHDRLGIAGSDLDGRVGFARGGAADEEWHVEALTGHFCRVVRHLLQGRSDQAAQTNHIDPLLFGFCQNLVAGHHDPEIDHLVVVTPQDHSDNVLADVVHVAFDRGKQHLALRRTSGRFLFLFHEGQQIRHGFFHDPRALDHLRQEHFPGPEEFSHDVHTVHQRAFDDLERFVVFLPGLFHVCVDELHDPLDQRMREPCFDRAFPPGIGLDRRLAFLFHGFGEVDQPLGRIRPPIQQDVLDQFQQVLGDLFIHAQLAGIDNRHVQPGLDGMIQKRRVHGLTHDVVPAEREGNIAHAAAGFAVRQRGLDLPDGLDEIDRVVVVLFDPRGDRQDIRIENNVLRRKGNLFRQNPVRPRANLDFPVDGVGLSCFIKRHHHDGRAVPLDQPGLFLECLLAFLEADGIDYALALHALQAGLDHRPLRAVDHDGHAANVGLRRDEVQEPHHGVFGIQQGFVHVDVDDLRATLYLLTSHRQGFLKLILANQAGEFR